MSVWSREQALALAPDAASAKAGQELATPRKWKSLGRAGDALWGECQGSGAKPYRTQAALDGPAFACSCPSHKFPCKHALGLVVLYAADPARLTEAAPPDWVASWLEARAKRAEGQAAKAQAKQEKAAQDPEANAAARRKREAARARKVADGLEELAARIADMVRRGLASAQAMTPDDWDDWSRRLIDAQAPGAARRAAALADLPTTGPDWQGTMLEALAKLQLLIEGHRHLDALPEPARIDLKAAVGYPSDLDAVRAGAGVRDTWMAVGRSVEIEDRLRVRRTWLVGRDSRRVALLLDFAALAQPPSAAGPEWPAGTAAEASLAFFPGAVPQRALVPERPSAFAPLDRLPGGVAIADALAADARARAANPWLERTLLLIADATLRPPQDDGPWTVRDAAGDVLLLARRFDLGWEALAHTGGAPVVIAAEFDGAAALPLGLLAGGAFHALAPGEAVARPPRAGALAGPPDVLAAWAGATAAALVGAERKPVSAAALASIAPAAVPGLEALEPASRLLAQAAILSAFGRAGAGPGRDPVPPSPPAPAEETPACTEAQAARLLAILGGEESDVLREWLGLLAGGGGCVPESALVPLLELGRGRSDLRDAIASVLGRRGPWLARLNRSWAWASADPVALDPDAAWQTGTRAERLAALRDVRRADPERGRAMLESTWAAEPADDRAALLEAFAVGLSMADEPWLDSRLDDRSKLVRKQAAELLMRLPASRLVGRMVERLRPLVGTAGRKGGAVKLVVVPPKECPADWVRDGIEPKTLAAVTPHAMGERAWWLAQLVAATPPSYWREAFGLAPADLVAAARGTEWAAALRFGWSRAAIRHGDAAFCEALLRPIEKFDTAEHELLSALPPGRRDALVLDLIAADSGPLGGKHPALLVLHLLDDHLGVDAGRAVLHAVRRSLDAALRKPKVRYDTDLDHIADKLGTLLPPELSGEADAHFPTGPDGTQPADAVADLSTPLETLRFRRAMHEEFAR